MVRVAVPDGVQADVVADALWRHGPASVLEGDGYLEAGFADVDAGERVAAALPWPATVEEVVDDSWQDAWRAHAGVVEVDPLVIVPAWRTVVSIDPGSAFGSGSHPSTVLCLRALVDVVRPGCSVLDVGCGSGVLAVAAASVGASPVVAIDVAAEAVVATTANARRNGVAAAVDVRHAVIEDVDATFEVVVANIGAAVLTSMARPLARRADDVLVLAGLLEEQVPSVVSGFAGEGMTLERVEVLEGWAAPRLVRTVDGGNGPRNR